MRRYMDSSPAVEKSPFDKKEYKYVAQHKTF